MRAPSTCLALAVLTTAARAAATPPRTPVDPEETLAQGDLPIDFERLPALPRAHDPVILRLPVALSVLAWRTASEQRTELGVGAIVSLPLDAIAIAPRRGELVRASFVPTSAVADAGAPIEIVEDVRLAPGAVRRLVVAAWRTARLAPEEERLADLAARARASATLPELRLRVMRTVDETVKATPSGDLVTTQSGAGVAMHYEARATWRLDRLVFADDEIALERLRSERNAERLRLTLHVLELVTAWQRAHARALDASLSVYERSDAVVREIAAATTLDALTNGEWSSNGPMP